MAENRSMRAMMMELEALHFLVSKKKSLGAHTMLLLAVMLIAGLLGWMAANSVRDSDFAGRSNYTAGFSAPIGERLKSGPALIRSGGILLLSSGEECPLGSTELSHVAVEVIKQGAAHYELISSRGPADTIRERQIYKTCKI
ncbi:MAG: hypothetical protein AAF724_06370 [Pseudomonadota bacterium]